MPLTGRNVVIIIVTIAHFLVWTFVTDCKSCDDVDDKYCY